MKAFWMSMILSSVSALGPSMAKAQERCAPFFETEYAMNGRVEVEPGALSGLKASEYATEIQRIDSLLGTLKAPSEVSIVVHDNMIFSSFVPTELTVYVGLRPGAIMGIKHKNIDLITLAHEYGHAIFDKNLRVQIPNFKKTSAMMENNSDDKFSPYTLYTGLHELFADAVVLVTTKNPEAISQLTSMPRKSLYRQKKNT